MSPTPERELPAEIEAAISELVDAALLYAHAEVDGAQREMTYERWDELRHAILAALEPEWVLRERCERLRKIALSRGVSEAYTASYDIKPGDLDDNLTATSSAHEGREGG